MIRDVKSLHLITQKVITEKQLYNPLDSIDDKRTSFMNFNNTINKRAMNIEDNSFSQDVFSGNSK